MEYKTGVFQENWSFWYPGKRLGHQDLECTEHFLVSPSRIIDDDAFGIDLIADYDQTFGATPSGDTDSPVWTITVRRLRGVMPDGRPVVLGEQSLKADIGGLSVNQVDVWIDFRAYDESVKEPEKLSKLVLVVKQAPAGLQNEGGKNPLYLGRHALKEGGGIQLLRRPRVRRLCSIGPIDENWGSWVALLEGRIEELWKIYCASGDVRSSAVATELQSLRAEWPFLPLPLLTSKLRRIRWWIDNPSGHLWELVKALCEPLDESNFTGEELPKRLCDLLPEPVVQVASEPLAPPSTGIVGRLLALLTNEVESHAPIGLLYAWYAELERSSRHGPGADITGFVPEAKRGNAWGQAVASVTNMVLAKEDRGNQTSALLDSLYTSVAKSTAGAAPMAFYWLAKTAALSPVFPKACSNILTNYFQLLRSAKGARSSDRLGRYIDRLRIPITSESIRYFSLFPRSASRQPSQTTRELACVILGNSGSGKSHLEEAIVQRWKDLQRGGDRLEIIRAVPSERGIPVDRLDLLILTIAPDETDNWQLEELKLSAVRLSNTFPNALVAIAFTKADEYGVVEFSGIRLAQQGQKPGQTAAQFAEFLGEVQRVAVVQQTYDNYQTVTPQISKRTTSIRRHLLTISKPLWINPGFGDRLLNGYMITAGTPIPPEDEYLARSSERTGVLHLLGDFVGTLKGRV